ncbi:MAG: ribbon-helix-helix protein, CopG family [Micromonosporaceae bacterium]
MKRTTIKIPDDIDTKLRAEAARREITVSELTREIFETHFGAGKRRRFLSAASFASGHSDTSERMEELLGEILEDRHRRRQDGETGSRSTDPEHPA